MGAERPKAFLDLAGEPLLVRAAGAFERAPSVDGIVAVVPEAELELARKSLGALSKLVGVVRGGARRQDSVLAGLERAPGGFDGVVLVHDAARALVDVDVIERVVKAARENGAALPVVSLPDTVKRVRGERVVETVDRSELGVAQTPQGFRVALLVRAYEEVRRQGVTVTDEAMAVERLGEVVTTVPGSERYRKITTPEDLAWAEWALTRRSGGGPS